jgi:hypothetical protein
MGRCRSCPELSARRILLSGDASLNRHIADVCSVTGNSPVNCSCVANIDLTAIHPTPLLYHNYLCHQFFLLYDDTKGENSSSDTDLEHSYDEVITLKLNQKQ